MQDKPCKIVNINVGLKIVSSESDDNLIVRQGCFLGMLSSRLREEVKYLPELKKAVFDFSMFVCFLVLVFKLLIFEIGL